MRTLITKHWGMVAVVVCVVVGSGLWAGSAPRGMGRSGVTEIEAATRGVSEVALQAAAPAGPRDPKKCGKVVALRAERAHRLGFRVIRIPAGCNEATLPIGYRGANGPVAGEIWRGSERLVFGIETAELRLYDPPIALAALSVAQVATPKAVSVPKHKQVAPVARRRRTVVAEWWDGDKHIVETTEE
jgi:hypothetical protein